MTRSPKELAIWWNNLMPLDRWYREKYGIRLFCKEHLETSLMQIKAEWEEDKIYRKILSENNNRGDEWIRPQIDAEKRNNQLVKDFFKNN